MIPLGNSSNLSAIFVFAKRRLCSQISVLFKASDNIPLSWGTEPSAYHLPASHSIRPPFNYRAGTSQCFFIILPPPHHLMMKNLLQEVWAFVLLLFSSFFIFWAFLFLSWMCVFVCVRGCLCTQPAYFSFFLSFIFCS